LGFGKDIRYTDNITDIEEIELPTMFWNEIHNPNDPDIVCDSVEIVIREHETGSYKNIPFEYKIENNS